MLPPGVSRTGAGERRTADMQEAVVDNPVEASEMGLPVTGPVTVSTGLDGSEAANHLINEVTMEGQIMAPIDIVSAHRTIRRHIAERDHRSTAANVTHPYPDVTLDHDSQMNWKAPSCGSTFRKSRHAPPPRSSER